MVQHDTLHTADMYGAACPFRDILAEASPEVQVALQSHQQEAPAKRGFDVAASVLEVSRLAVQNVAEVRPVPSA